MYVDITNENFGYSVATFGDFVAVGNPGLVRYNPATASKNWSGSVDVYRYNYQQDRHDYVATLYKDNVLQEVLLATEALSASRTEPTGSDPFTQNQDIQIDRHLYTHMSEDGYGVSVDIKNKTLVVGCPYYQQHVETTASFQSTATGSGVDIFDLEKYEQDPLNTNLVSNTLGTVAIGTGSMAGYIKIYVSSAPAGYDKVELLFSTNVSGPYTQVVARNNMNPNGGYVEFYIHTSIFSSYPVGFFLFRFSIKTSPYLMTIPNPDPPFTGSFGYAVSINDGWLAVGSPYVSGSEGMVYIYKNIGTGNLLSWSFEQKITPIIDIKGLMFGSCLELNKVTGSVSGSLIVGVGNSSGSRAFLFEHISGSWTQTYIFTPHNPSYPLTFGGYDPYTETFVTHSGYGTAVGIYNNTVVIGAPRDRVVKEYTSSYAYEQGAVYVYERCPDLNPLRYSLVYKTYGDETILKNNRLGYSVSIYNDKIIAGSPKVDVTSKTTCYIQATVEQLHYCDAALENTLNGQSVFLLKNTSSYDWELAKVYQNKKKYLEPYRSYGYSVDIADKSMVIGAPMILADINRYVNVSTSQSFDTELGEVAGKAFIYNLHNYREQFHVGNVFYRDGKVVLMTSGSIFDGILFNPISPYTYEYQVDYQGEYTIYEKQIVCTVNPGEFNVSTNPTAITREVPLWDVNGNGYFDFQDVDVLLSYMQYKNTQLYSGGEITTNWSSSIVTSDDEQSLLRYYQENYDSTHTNVLISESIQRFEFVDTWMQTDLDLNQDNKIDTNDLNIMWKYFSNRLTQQNYGLYITPACSRKQFSDIIDHMDLKTKRTSLPLIRSEFFDYERLVATDRTGSYLAPMATTIGLYSGLDLVAVAKLGSPIKISSELPINFVVKMDF